jgi:hypothetical protein
MTTSTIEAVQNMTGRELDSACATEVMGWVRLRDYNYWMSLQGGPGNNFDLHDMIIRWKPSEKLDQAARVQAEAVRRFGPRAIPDDITAVGICRAAVIAARTPAPELEPTSSSEEYPVCQVCRERHDPAVDLSFDGKGINSCGMYRTRLATFTSGCSDDIVALLGPLFESSFKLLAVAHRVLDRSEGECTKHTYADGKQTLAGCTMTVGDIRMAREVVTEALRGLGGKGTK